MPDSPPQTDTRNPRRFTVSVTRVCLASGTLQIPFAMRGVLKPGTHRVRDAQRDETVELTFEPPRSLAGLDEIFAAHELQPNDEVILTLTEQGLALDVVKRPRRKAPAAKVEPWESVRAARREDAGRTGEAQPAMFEPPAAAPQTQASRAERPSHDSPDPHDPNDADAPRLVRVRRRSTGELEGEPPAPPRDAREDPSRAPAGAAGSRGAAEPASDTHPARRFFEQPPASDADAGLGESFWRRSEDDERAPRGDDDAAKQGEGILARIARTVVAARGALSFRPTEHDEDDASDAQHDAGRRTADAAPEDRDAPRHVHPAPARPAPQGPRPAQGNPAQGGPSRGGSPHGGPPRDPSPQARSERSGASPGGELRDRDPSQARAQTQTRAAPPVPRGGAGAAPPRERSDAARQPAATRRDVVVEDASAETMDQYGPPMWELGEGDLRQRLVRFLLHPDVPVILRADLVAHNFGLGVEVADAMLEDLANDKIDGLAVTKVRDETYRISRAPTKL